MDYFKTIIINELSELTGNTPEQVSDTLETPPSPALGDYAYPVFPLSKIFKNDPKIIANELSEKLLKKKLPFLIKPINAYIKSIG